MVRTFAVAVLSVCSALAACAPSEDAADAPSSAWSFGPVMPRGALAPGVAGFGQQVVVAGGFDGLTITARVDAFDPTDGTWQALPDVPVAWTDANLATVGTTLYLVGGLEGAQRVARGDGFALDPLDRVWRPISAIEPGDARGAAGVATAPGRIYLLGGASATGAVASCLEYDVAMDRWTRLPDLPAPRAHLAAMRRADGTLIVAGGFADLGSSTPAGEVWVLPPPGAVPRAWTPRTPLGPLGDPRLRGGCASGLVLGELVCAGGERGGVAQDFVDSYDPFLDEWTPREPMPVDRTGTQAASVGGRLFVPGGTEAGTAEPTDTLLIYAPLDAAPR